MNYKQRISTLLKLLSREHLSSVAVISTNPQIKSSHDLSFPYRPNSSFLYLTGAKAFPMLLIIGGRRKRPLLIGKPVDPLRVKWDGPQEKIEVIAERIGAEVLLTQDIEGEAFRAVHGYEQVFLDNTPGSPGWALGERLVQTPSHLSRGIPSTVAPLDKAIQHLRLYKDKDEIQAIIHSAEIVAESFRRIRGILQPGIDEWTIARTLEYHFALHHAVPSFETIVAAGPNAAVLHYVECARKCREGEMILIDCGAGRNFYSSDITRCFPIGDTASGILLEIYDIVAESQLAAIRAVRDGVLIKKVFEAAAKVLTEGLVSLGVLRGKTSALMAKKAYLPFFPHSIGHSLGLDVHDIGNLRGNNGARLETGMVFTIEPGLYFPKKIKNIPACGVRIEDDVLVTAGKCKILTAACPVERYR